MTAVRGLYKKGQSGGEGLDGKEVGVVARAFRVLPLFGYYMGIAVGVMGLVRGVMNGMLRYFSILAIPAFLLFGAFFVVVSAHVSAVLWGVARAVISRIARSIVEGESMSDEILWRRGRKKWVYGTMIVGALTGIAFHQPIIKAIGVLLDIANAVSCASYP